MFRKLLRPVAPLLTALALIGMLLSPVLAQQGIQYPPGSVFGNDTAAQRPGRAATLSAMFDRAFCATVGQVVARTTGGWVCDRNIPLKAAYYGVVCDGVTPMSANLQTAVNAAKTAGGIPVELPVPTTAGALCVHNANVFTNVFLPANGVLTTPGMDIRGPGRDVTVIDTRVANGAAFSTNPDWQAAYKSMYLSSASTGGSGALASNTYYVTLTETDPLANEVMISSPTVAPSYVVTGPTGRISVPLQPLNTGYCYNIYISTSPTTTPDHYATVSGADAICVAGNQTVFVNAVGSAHAVPTSKRAAWQTSNFSGFSIGNSTAVAGAVGISWFKTAYSTIDKMQIGSVADGIQILNYAGDADSSLNPKITQTKLDHITGWGLNAAGVSTNLSYLYLENVICNLCGTLPTNYLTPANYSSGFTISTISLNATNVVTTSAPHTFQTNDEIYVSGVLGMTQLAAGWYRVNVTGSTTFNLEDLVTGSIIDTALYSPYTASSGKAALAWRPPVANPAGGATNGGGFAWTGLTATIVHSACTQGSNVCVYASEIAGSSNLKMIGVTAENVTGKGFYIGSLAGGTADGLECLTNTSFGATHMCIQLGTGFAAGGVSNFRVQDVKVRSDVVIATQFVQYRNTNNPTASIDTNRITGVNWFSYDLFTTQNRFLNFAFDQVPGQVVLSVPSTNVWKVSPSGAGPTLPVHLGSVRGDGEWVPLKVPDAGLTFAVTTSAANTTYNVYTFNNAINTAPIALTVAADTVAPVINGGYKVQSTGQNATYLGTLTTDASGNFQPTGAQTSWYPAGPSFVSACTLAASVASNNLTIALKNPSGADPSPTSPCTVSFRNATATTGDFPPVTVTAATSVVFNSGSGFGAPSSSTPFRIWVTAWNNAGTVVLGASNQLSSSATNGSVASIDEAAVQSSTACNACATATAAQTFYTTAAQTSKAVRILGYMDWASGLATTGVWASGPTTIQLMGAGVKKPGEPLQRFFLSTTTSTTDASGAFVATNLAKNFTKASAANLVRLETDGIGISNGANAAIKVQIHRGSAACTTAIGVPGFLNALPNATLGTLVARWIDVPAASGTTTAQYTVCMNAAASISASFPYSSAGGTLLLEEIMG